MGFQQGLSGLNAASKNLDVIGHNIANSNTMGFKTSRAEFAEMVASVPSARVSAVPALGPVLGWKQPAVTEQFTQGGADLTGQRPRCGHQWRRLLVVKLPKGGSRALPEQWRISSWTTTGNFGDRQ